MKAIRANASLERIDLELTELIARSRSMKLASADVNLLDTRKAMWENAMLRTCRPGVNGAHRNVEVDVACFCGFEVV
eukprot:CAMPEP_0203886988 /NCGR_PEP_ID=MMETSP0359-20131031/30743_1 /ASSEMBLY_ACC=CAM_ASM_000338 /TAXON_ID=268821 /ORGANISM="Scrippsiella Hangoei, Strain SHTV-5" /LENGTH=76 /DNA_ID=CAMNT_0050807919 /DNA_START=190 /DNA_END=418 /DNA_ORIENTATION=-